MRIAREDSERDVLVRALFNLARGRNPDAVRIQKQRHHHLRRELRDGLQDEIREMFFRQLLKRTLKKQKPLPRLVRLIRLQSAVRSLPRQDVDPFSQGYSNWLLGREEQNGKGGLAPPIDL